MQTKRLVEILKRRHDTEDTGLRLDNSIILKWFLKIQRARVWTGIILWGNATYNELLLTRDEQWHFVKLASQEGLCSMETDCPSA